MAAQQEKKLGLGSVVSISVGLIIATSCLVSLGQGAGTIGVTFIFAMVIACILNMTTIEIIVGNGPIQASVYCASPPVVFGINAFNSEREATVVWFLWDRELEQLA